MAKYVFYFLSGEQNLAEGSDMMDAFRSLGFTDDDVKLLDGWKCVENKKDNNILKKGNDITITVYSGNQYYEAKTGYDFFSKCKIDGTQIPLKDTDFKILLNAVNLNRSGGFMLSTCNYELRISGILV